MNLGIVWGYLPNIDEEALVAKKAGLHQRVRLALNRYPDEAPGMFEIVFDKDFTKLASYPII